MSHERVEIRTLDGTILRGHLFAAKERGPGVVMSPGVSPSTNAHLVFIELPKHSDVSLLLNQSVVVFCPLIE